MSDIQVRLADWHKDHDELRRIREAVFVVEQAVPPEQEWDADDAEALHFLAFDGDYPVGTARLQADGRIGRVSVLREWRGLGVGDALLHAVLEEAARRGLQQQTLSAQTQAVPFYQRLGFEVISDEFLEAGIPHVDMLRNS